MQVLFHANRALGDNTAFSERSQRGLLHEEEERGEADHVGPFQLIWKTSFLPVSPAYSPGFICNLRFWQLLLLEPACRAAGRPPWPGHCCWFCFWTCFFAARGTSLWGQSTKRPFGSEQGAGQHQNRAGWPAHTGAFRSGAGHFVPLLNSGRGWAIKKRDIRRKREWETSLWSQIMWFPVVREEGWMWGRRVWSLVWHIQVLEGWYWASFSFCVSQHLSGWQTSVLLIIRSRSWAIYYDFPTCHCQTQQPVIAKCICTGACPPPPNKIQPYTFRWKLQKVSLFQLSYDDNLFNQTQQKNHLGLSFHFSNYHQLYFGWKKPLNHWVTCENSSLNENLLAQLPEPL